ncbi:MAG: hypothetical protein L0Y60_05705 [Beijerinckiaceae bacterium]|nr:hypothetical protein [Beijerinckiaceae bacterium]
MAARRPDLKKNLFLKKISMKGGMKPGLLLATAQAPHSPGHHPTKTSFLGGVQLAIDPDQRN